MKKQILSEELRRMQQLAGLISENHVSDYSKEDLEKMSPGELSKLDYTSKQFPDLSKKVSDFFSSGKYAEGSPIKNAWLTSDMETRDRILKNLNDIVAQDKNKWNDNNEFAKALNDSIKRFF